MCPIVQTIFSVGQGFEPLALQHDLFVGTGLEPLSLQHDLFVALISCFRPIVSLTYVIFTTLIAF